MDNNSLELVKILAEFCVFLRKVLAKNALSLLFAMIRDPKIDCTTACEADRASLLRIVSTGRQFISAITCNCFDALVECMSQSSTSTMIIS